jgi:hypothetical protein
MKMNSYEVSPMSNQAVLNQSVNGVKDVETLVHPDGRTVAFLDQGNDDKGEFLVVEHSATRQGAMNGPHWLGNALTVTLQVLPQSFKRCFWEVWRTWLKRSDTGSDYSLFIFCS